MCDPVRRQSRLGTRCAGHRASLPALKPRLPAHRPAHQSACACFAGLAGAPTPRQTATAAKRRTEGLSVQIMPAPWPGFRAPGSRAAASSSAAIAAVAPRSAARGAPHRCPAHVTAHDACHGVLWSVRALRARRKQGQGRKAGTPATAVRADVQDGHSARSFWLTPCTLYARAHVAASPPHTRAGALCAMGLLRACSSTKKSTVHPCGECWEEKAGRDDPNGVFCTSHV